MKTQPLSPHAGIQAALDRWARPEVPDYASFEEWLAERLTIKDRHLILPHLSTKSRNEVASYVQALLDLHQDYERQVRAANTTAGEPYRLLFNSLKLLAYAVKSLPVRTKERFALAKDSGVSPERLDEDLSSCSQSQLHLRFFTALQRENDRVALKILGRLRERDHDPGELEYLEALCHFHANEFREAIYWARKVPEGTVDYSGARAVVLEAQAFLTDTEGLASELKAHQPKEITPSFLAYLMQVSIRQSDDPDAVVVVFNELGKQWSTKGPHTTEDPFYGPFNRYSCRIAKELAIALRDLENQQECMQQDASVQSAFTDAPLDVPIRRVLYASMVDSALLDDLLSAEADSRFVPIVKRLLNVPYRPEFADFAESLRTQLELGAIDLFIENVATNLQDLINTPEEAKWDLIELAYTEASATNHEQLPVLRRALEENGRLEQHNGTHIQSVQNARLREGLTPIGWHFFQQACWAHERSLAERSPWQDAGMISLGFFRILEVELNQRIVLPLVALLDFDALRAVPKPTKAQKTECVPENIIDKLGNVHDGGAHGLELGALYLLLQRTQIVSEPDKNRKELLHHALVQLLTTDGKAAFQDGRLAVIINPAVREQYRNPPAHSRFLPQHVATACKEHVEHALLDIVAWLPKP